MKFHSLTVADVERLTADSAAVTFAVPAHLRDVYAFKAGQSLTLRRTIDGTEHRRSYSICAPVGAAPRVGVREVPGGLFSSWLVRDVAVGDIVEVQTPTGTFEADPVTPGRHLCIAAGSGITPVLSIAASALVNPRSQVTLLYGNRKTDTVMFAEELADLKNRYPDRLELVHVLSREPRDVELFSGRLDADRLRRLLTLLVPLRSIDHVWLCGPFGLITDARAVLDELGFPRDRSMSRPPSSTTPRPSSTAAPATSPSCLTAGPPRRRCRSSSPSSTPPPRPAATCRSRARAASAAPAVRA
jgi:ring-1,2-phenylacetyl-CoA epoxidase subunit PaaE